MIKNSIQQKTLAFFEPSAGLAKAAMESFRHSPWPLIHRLGNSNRHWLACHAVASICAIAARCFTSPVSWQDVCLLPKLPAVCPNLHDLAFLQLCLVFAEGSPVMLCHHVCLLPELPTLSNPASVASRAALDESTLISIICVSALVCWHCSSSWRCH